MAKDNGMSRRDFLGIFGKVSVFLACTSLPGISKGVQLLTSSRGTATMSGTDADALAEGIQAIARQRVTWIIEYTCGSTGIEPGGRVRLTPFRFHEAKSSGYQNTNPSGDGYFTVSTDGACSLAVEIRYGYIDVTIEGAALNEGEKVTMVIGDTSGGNAGFRVAANAGAYNPNTYDTNTSLFPRTYRVSVALSTGAVLVPLDQPDLHYEILHDSLARMDIFAPSICQCGENCRCLVRLTDAYGNVVEDYEGTVLLSSSDSAATYPASLIFTTADGGIKVVDDVVFNTPGLQTLSGTVQGEGISQSSNTVECLSSTPEKRLFWGDIHVHSMVSDGQQSPDYAYNYARNVSNHDLSATADHSMNPAKSALIDYWAGPKAAEFYEPGQFTTLLAFEWTSNDLGHHNFYYRSLEGEIFPHQVSIYSDLNEVFNALQGQQVISIPHHVARAPSPVDWSYHDPKLQRLVEIYSAHGCCEYQGCAKYLRGQLEGYNVQDALSLGYKLGLMCSSDSHTTRPGLLLWYDILDYTPGVVAVCTESNTREAIWDALYARRCYGTTGSRIAVDFRINGAVMGSEIAPAPGQFPAIYVRAIGGIRNLVKVEIVKGAIGASTPFPVVHEVTCGERLCEFTWTDTSEMTDCFYYVKVWEEGNEIAWAGPIWVSPSMRIKSIVRSSTSGNTAIRWGCLPYRLYSVYFRDSMDGEWQLAEADIPSSDTGEIVWIDNGSKTGLHPSYASKRFYEVRADG